MTSNEFLEELRRLIQKGWTAELTYLEGHILLKDTEVTMLWHDPIPAVCQSLKGKNFDFSKKGNTRLAGQELGLFPSVITWIGRATYRVRMGKSEKKVRGQLLDALGLLEEKN